MTDPNTVGGLIGGALIGFAAVLLLALNGRIAGVWDFRQADHLRNLVTRRCARLGCLLRAAAPHVPRATA
jgi:predicted lipid-binding transport protein (Tim44 family)